MEGKKLIIESKKYRGGTSVISARLANTLIEKIDSIAADTGRNRNEILQKMIEFALDNLEIKDE